MVNKLTVILPKINNYFQYAENAKFDSMELMFQNPHSLIVELGYWLGWLGLVCFSIAIFHLMMILSLFARIKNR